MSTTDNIEAPSFADVVGMGQGPAAEEAARALADKAIEDHFAIGDAMPSGDSEGRTKGEIRAGSEPEEALSLEELRAKGHEINRAVNPSKYDEEGNRKPPEDGETDRQLAARARENWRQEERLEAATSAYETWFDAESESEEWTDDSDVPSPEFVGAVRNIIDNGGTLADLEQLAEQVGDEAAVISAVQMIQQAAFEAESDAAQEAEGAELERLAAPVLEAITAFNALVETNDFLTDPETALATEARRQNLRPEDVKDLSRNDFVGMAKAVLAELPMANEKEAKAAAVRAIQFVVDGVNAELATLQAEAFAADAYFKGDLDGFRSRYLVGLKHSDPAKFEEIMTGITAPMRAYNVRLEALFGDEEPDLRRAFPEEESNWLTEIEADPQSYIRRGLELSDAELERSGGYRKSMAKAADAAHAESLKKR